MPCAYGYLTNQQKNSITEIDFVTYEDRIKLTLRLNSPLGLIHHIIVYNKIGSAITTVEFANKESPTIEHNFVYVFLEDLEMLLKHQKSVLSYFYANFHNEETIETISGRIEMTLKSRRVKVKNVRILKTTVAQAMSMVQRFDQNEPFTVRLIDVMDTESFDSSWNGLSEVEIEDDGQSISFKVANPTVQPISPKEEEPLNSSLRESAQTLRDFFALRTPDDTQNVAQTVLESRLPMKSILRHLQFFDIENLRKVNHGIRECIDLIKPNPHIKKCSIRFERNLVNTLIFFTELKNGEFKNTKYIMSRIGGLFFDNTDHKSMCLNDIGNALHFQTECMKELIISYQFIYNFPNPYEEYAPKLDTTDFSKRLGDVLRRREDPLKTIKFVMGSSSQMEVMEILPAFDSNHLKCIELMWPIHSYSVYNEKLQLPFQVDQLSKTVQWKKAERLLFKYLTITTPIPDMNILNFADLEILVKTISSEDVAYLKANLLNSSKFQKYKISFWESTINESLHTLIGEPYRTVPAVKKIWYSRIQNTNDYIHIVLDISDGKDKYGDLKPKSITFKRVEEEDTPVGD